MAESETADKEGSLYIFLTLDTSSTVEVQDVPDFSISILMISRAAKNVWISADKHSI